jgi:protein kinase C substrate 80K-H
MSGQCFTYSQAQYTYEMCPYGDASQKEGGSSTKLGGWEGWKVREDGVKLLNFVNGQTCWQGPARSLTVVTRCGVNNEIKGVEEPSRCVYEMEFTTPAVCSEEHAKKLQQELEDQMTTEDE